MGLGWPPVGVGILPISVSKFNSKKEQNLEIEICLRSKN
jgi:hypothetical protein